MLAQLSRVLPRGDFVYEPKWDGFRCLVFAGPRGVDLRSRNQRPLGRYFPEVVEALQPLAEAGAVLDGELVIAKDAGFDFPALMTRLHPSPSRVAKLRAEAPATFIAFDLLAQGGQELTDAPFAVRRARLEAVIPRGVPSLTITPATADPDEAERWLHGFSGNGVDGVMAKPRELRYQPGRRAMVKVKREHTVDCVVAGLRLQVDTPVLGSLLLGLYEDGVLRHVGVCSTFTRARRRELLEELRPLVVGIRGHVWERGFGIGRSPLGRLAGSAGRWDPALMDLDWTPLAPTRVCEVGFDQLDDRRFRHPARFLRWRPDRDASSCAIEQLGAPGPVGTEVLRGAA